MGTNSNIRAQLQRQNISMDFETAFLLFFAMIAFCEGEPWGQPMVPQPTSPIGPITPTGPIRPTGPIAPIRPTGVVPEVIEARNTRRRIGGTNINGNIRGTTSITRGIEGTIGSGVVRSNGLPRGTETTRDKCSYDCRSDGACHVTFTPAGPYSGPTIGSCFAPEFGGSCSGTPPACSDCTIKFSSQGGINTIENVRRVSVNSDPIRHTRIISAEDISTRSRPNGQIYGWTYDPVYKTLSHYSRGDPNSRKTSRKTLHQDDLKALGKFINQLTRQSDSFV